MDKQEAKKRIEKLKKMISHHRYLYHVLDRQELSDAAFDSLKHELYKLEQEYPELITPDSPTQRVGGEPLKEFEKVEHSSPMLSIEDVFSEEELKSWQDYLIRLSPSTQSEYFAEPKIDGFAVALIYENGLFKKGATRGNGKIGEDITQNLKTIESIPLKIEREGLKLPKTMEIRGEVYMAKRDFEKFNKELEEKDQKPYSNPRNLAAGSIRQLDPKVAASRPLRFLAYDIVTDTGQSRHSEEHKLLPDLGFKSYPGKVCKNLGDIVDFWRDLAKKRETLPFQIDGLVIVVNNNDLFDKLGVAGKSPRGIRAFKFSPKQTTTRILDVKVQVGRTGAITPLALLKPVQVAGVTITKATLHNEDQIKRLGVKIGDTVIIERAGDVIPAVAKVLTELRTGQEKDFHFPKACPICNTKLIRPEGEAVWRCPDSACRARKKEILHHFASKKAFDIDGLGPQIINQLLDENLVSEAPDLFKLKEGDLVPLERFAKKSSENLIKSIENSKKVSLSRFIYSLGIRHVGEETAIDLANHFGDINKLKKASKDELESLSDVGGVVAKSINTWFKSKENLDFIEELIESGVGILPPKKISQKLEGKTFVLTGTLEGVTREEAEKQIRLLGGHPSNSVSRLTDYLVKGTDPGSKLQEAQKLGVKIIEEKEFLEILRK